MKVLLIFSWVFLGTRDVRGVFPSMFQGLAWRSKMWEGFGKTGEPGLDIYDMGGGLILEVDGMIE